LNCFAEFKKTKIRINHFHTPIKNPLSSDLMG
jgi:hypothetical protein